MYFFDRMRHAANGARWGRGVALLASFSVVFGVSQTVVPGEAAIVSVSAERPWWEPIERPEDDMQLNVEGEPTTTDPGEPVRGFIDAHSHLNSNVGFGGGLICGQPFAEGGAKEALGNCPISIVEVPNVLVHLFGADRDLIERLMDSVKSVDPKGYPTFRGWPGVRMYAHQSAYYTWLERSWRAGQRIVVNQLVSNGAVCGALRLVGANSSDANCDEMAALRLQRKAALDMEEYIDGLYGGSGKGFLRVTETPEEAREVIQQGKLAIVTAVETSEPFGCKQVRDVAQCTKADIVKGLDEFKDMGVSSLYLCHKFDNALCGVRFDKGTSGVAVEKAQEVSTLTSWETEPCDGPAADYPIHGDTVKRCNRRGLTDLGEFTVREMIKRGMSIEIDHMSAKAAAHTLEILEKEQYPGVVSSHSVMDESFEEPLTRLGGFKVGYPGPVQEHVEEWRRGKEDRRRAGNSGYGLGVDANGLGTRTEAGYGERPIKYPFIAPDGKTRVYEQKSGERKFNINKDGLAHSGMVPDYIEQVRVNGGGSEYVAEVMNGAEEYLQFWAAARSHSENVQVSPATDDSADDRWTKLSTSPEAPDQMILSVNRPTSTIRPGERVTVRLEWSPHKIANEFRSAGSKEEKRDLAQDLIKVWSKNSASLTLDGLDCREFGRFDGGDPRVGWQRGVGGSGTVFVDLDIATLREKFLSILNDVVSYVTGSENALAELLQSDLRASCEFTVPEGARGNINVGGNIVLTNLFGLLRKEESTVGYLKVAEPEAPAKPSISGTSDGELSLARAGVLKGKADHGVDVRLKVDGDLRMDPVTTANASGRWEMSLPEELKPGGEYVIEVVAQNKDGGKKMDSEPAVLTIR